MSDFDARWAIKTTADPALEIFVFTAATAQTSAAIDMKAAGYLGSTRKAFLLVWRTGTYTKNLLSNVNIAVNHAAARSGDTLTSGVVAAQKDVAVAVIDAKKTLAKIALPDDLLNNITVTFTPTGAPTTITLKGQIVFE